MERSFHNLGAGSFIFEFSASFAIRGGAVAARPSLQAGLAVLPLPPEKSFLRKCGRCLPLSCGSARPHRKAAISRALHARSLSDGGHAGAFGRGPAPAERHIQRTENGPERQARAVLSLRPEKLGGEGRELAPAAVLGSRRTASMRSAGTAAGARRHGPCCPGRPSP